MILRSNNQGTNSISLQIGKIDYDKKYILYDVIIAVEGRYKRLSFGSFGQAVDIYDDMIAQYIEED